MKKMAGIFVHYFSFAFLAVNIMTAFAYSQSKDERPQKSDQCPPQGEKHKYLDVPIDYKNIENGTFRFHYKLQNGFSENKKTIVLLHGGPGENMKCWDLCPGSYCLSELSPNYNIVTIDERGAGCSLLPKDANQEFMTIKASAHDIEALRKHLVGDFGKISIMGLSFGTVLGIVYTSSYNQNVDKLILEGSVSSNEYMINLAFEKNFNTMLSQKPDLQKTYKTLIQLIEKGELKITLNDLFDMRDLMGYSYRGTWVIMPILIKQLAKKNYKLWDLIIKNIEDSSGHITLSPAYKYIMCRELFDFSFPYFRIKPILENICKDFEEVNPLWPKYNALDFTAKITVPTLLIVGRWDGAAAPYNTHILDQALGYSKSFVVPFAGHGVLFEKRKCDTMLIESFLQKGLTVELDDIFNSNDCKQSWANDMISPSPTFNFPYYFKY